MLESLKAAVRAVPEGGDDRGKSASKLEKDPAARTTQKSAVQRAAGDENWRRCACAPPIPGPGGGSGGVGLMSCDLQGGAGTPIQALLPRPASCMEVPQKGQGRLTVCEAAF